MNGVANPGTDTMLPSMSDAGSDSDEDFDEDDRSASITTITTRPEEDADVLEGPSEEKDSSGSETVIFAMTTEEEALRAKDGEG